MHELTDTQLITKTRAGDRDAFGVLFERYLAMAKAVAYGILHDRAVAEDIAQDAMLHAYLSLDNLREPSSYSSWLHGIVRNLSQNYLRRYRAKRNALADSMEEWHLGERYPMPLRQNVVDPLQSDPAQLTEILFHQERIQQAIETLPPKRREAATLFYLEQLSIREIAQQLAASETAVKSRLFQARKQLQIQLAPLIDDWHELAAEKPANYMRKDTMIKIDSIRTFDRGDNQHAIVLYLSKERKRYMQMWMGTSEGYTLSRILNGEETARPLTQNTMAQMIELLGAKVTGVEINALKEYTFYASIYLDCNGDTKQLDARPSDAVPLALIVGAPIYVADDVMEKCGHELSSSFNEDDWLADKVAKHQEQIQLLTTWQEALSADRTKFTKRAQQVCTTMIAEAEDYYHPYVGTEHLLLGMVGNKESLAAEVLAEMGVTYAIVKELVDEMVERGSQPSYTRPTIAPRLTMVFELAEAERAKREHVYIGSEHLLVGIFVETESETSDNKGMAIRVLHKLDVDGESVLKRIEAIINKNA